MFEAFWSCSGAYVCLVSSKLFTSSVIYGLGEEESDPPAAFI